MTRQMISLQVSADTVARLERAAAQCRVSRSVFIRWAIEDALELHDARMEEALRHENQYREKEVSEYGNP